MSEMVALGQATTSEHFQQRELLILNRLATSTLKFTNAKLIISDRPPTNLN